MDEALSVLPWVPVNVGGSDLLAKVWFGDTQYRVLLTDLICVWEEDMNADDIQSRAQELNKRLRASTQAFFSHLCSVARPCFSSPDVGHISAHVSLERHGDGLTVRLRSELSQLPFYWEFRCTPTPVALVCGQLVRPLLAVTRVLQKQVEDLADLLVRKDAEIQDYQENGAELSRARLQTEPFEVHRYREKFLTQTVLQMGVLDSLGFDSELQELFVAVNSVKSSQKRKRSPDSSPAPEDDLNMPEHHVSEQTTDVPAGVGTPLASQEQNDVRTRKADSEQTLPPKAAAVGSKEPSSRLKKRKVVGLFR